MSDIVERLRSGAAHQTLVTTGLVNQAADTITALRAEVEKQASVLRAWQARAAKAEAEVERLRAGLERDPTEAEVADACMSYRHDFGLLSVDERTMFASQAKWWLDAWQKAFARSIPTHGEG